MPSVASTVALLVGFWTREQMVKGSFSNQSAVLGLQQDALDPHCLVKIEPR